MDELATSDCHRGAATSKPVLLTVSGEIPETISIDIAREARPRADYLELARRLDADLIDYAKARNVCGWMGRWIERLCGRNALLACACWLQRKRYQAIVTDGEQIGLPLAVLFKVSPSRRRPRHIMITHVISASKKTLLMDYLRLASAIDHFVVYCRWQHDYLRSRWNIAPIRIDVVPFMVDERFFDPAKVHRQEFPRPRICSVGLERRDYPTLMRAVEGLDIDVIIAAASPWSKQRDSTADHAVPKNVFVRKFTQFELRQLYADCELVVMPLQAVQFQAGITAILEAMAMSKPVICSKTAGQGDVIVAGETGSYVPVGDAAALRAEITRLLGRPDEILRLGTNARAAVVRALSLDHYAKRLSAIVKKTRERA
ncbi:MAG: glycosyltransferase family 4 protein [Hyphomicrobiaceae bacterium]